MKPASLILLSIATLLVTAAIARADARPDFNDDAKPILRQYPSLLAYVRSNFEVKETGYSRFPGDDDHRPPPPYIFRARPRGSNGPYTITLLIQPGPPGHVLRVGADRGTPLPPGAAMVGGNPGPPSAGYGYGPQAPGYGPQSPGYGPQSPVYGANEQPTPASAPPAPGGNSTDMPPAPVSNSSASTPAPSAPSDFDGISSSTPSGPIHSTSSSSSSGNSLAPPPDPAPSQ